MCFIVLRIIIVSIILKQKQNCQLDQTLETHNLHR